jgi:hypothetical protein
MKNVALSKRSIAMIICFVARDCCHGTLHTVAIAYNDDPVHVEVQIWCHQISFVEIDYRHEMFILSQKLLAITILFVGIPIYNNQNKYVAIFCCHN